MLTQMSTVLTDPLNCYTIKISSESKDCLTQSHGDYNYRDHVYKKSGYKTKNRKEIPSKL